MPDRTGRSKSGFEENVRCYLCGLRIPADIVSPDHPLFGTIDHIIPRVKGGKDAAGNRAPAHLCCNRVKGGREISDELKAECLALVSAAFARYPIPLYGKAWKRERKAAGLRELIRKVLKSNSAARFPMRSENDICANCGEIRFVHCPTEPNGLLPKMHEVDGRLVALRCPGFEPEPEQRTKSTGEQV